MKILGGNHMYITMSNGVQIQIVKHPNTIPTGVKTCISRCTCACVYACMHACMCVYVRMQIFVYTYNIYVLRSLYYFQVIILISQVNACAPPRMVCVASMLIATSRLLSINCDLGLNSQTELHLARCFFACPSRVVTNSGDHIVVVATTR